MTLGEFKAWFEGFTECIDKQPTQKQWKRICQRVGEIDEIPTRWPVFIERYWPPRRRWDDRWWSVSNNTTTVAFNATAKSEPQWQSAGGFTDLGREEAKMISA